VAVYTGSSEHVNDISKTQTWTHASNETRLNNSGDGDKKERPDVAEPGSIQESIDGWKK